VIGDYLDRYGLSDFKRADLDPRDWPKLRESAICGICERHVSEHGAECMFLIVLESTPPPALVVTWAWAPGYTDEEIRAMLDTIEASGFASPMMVTP